MKKVRIYSPTKTAMQSGDANTGFWLLEFEPESPDSRFVEPLMGWTGSSDMNQEIRLKFLTKEAAIAYAHKQGFEYEIKEPKAVKVTPKSYAANFLRPVEK